jgi:hypothetical protein
MSLATGRRWTSQAVAAASQGKPMPLLPKYSLHLIAAAAYCASRRIWPRRMRQSDIAGLYRQRGNPHWLSTEIAR